MESEKDICFHIIPNGTNIGFGRVRGFLVGKSPYVSFVDYDDLIQPEIFFEINQILESGYDWCYTDEMLINEEGEELQPGWSSHPELYSPLLRSFQTFNSKDCCHHIVAFRRNLLRIDNLYIMRQLTELAEAYLYRELGRNNNYYHLQKVGYFWRQHENNGYKQFKAWKDLFMLDGKEVKLW